MASQGPKKTVSRGEALAPSPQTKPIGPRTEIREALAVLFALRLVNALCVRTFFQPDEYFQALEPAWQMAYGQDSGAWITWEWKHKLRSSLHPGIFAAGYFTIANYLGTIPLPTYYGSMLLVYMPRAVQAMFAAVSDWYAWRLGEKLYGENSTAAWAVLLMSITNPWQWYCSTRTFSNSLEATLTIAALYYWPWELLGTDKKSSVQSSTIFDSLARVNSLRLSIILAAFAVLLRPTNVLIWAAIGTLTLTRLTLDGESPLNSRNLTILIREGLLCGSLVLGVSLFVDRQYFGEWTFPPFTWLHFNIAQSLAVFYGQNDWHYYLSQGITLSCTTITPFALVGIWRATSLSSAEGVTTTNALRAMSFAALTTISALSLISHKEVRFIYPLIPILHILAAPYIIQYFTYPSEDGIPTASGPVGIKRKPLLTALLLFNVLMAVYLGWLHAAAPIQVMSFLRGEFQRLHPQHLDFPLPLNLHGLLVRNATEPLELFALFLTPCHTTPWRSHLLYPALKARALSCDPPLDSLPDSPERRSYVPEDRRFDANKSGFLSSEMWASASPREDMPRYIVGFEGIEDALKDYFGPQGQGSGTGVKLTRQWSAFNGLFTDDERKAGQLVVWDTGIYATEPDSL